MKTEPESMNFWLWLGAALGVGFGLLASAIAAIASVLKSASISKKRGTLILLFISNVASGMFNLTTAITIKEFMVFGSLVCKTVIKNTVPNSNSLSENIALQQISAAEYLNL